MMEKRKILTIAVDFDGTCVSHRYPDIGVDSPLAVKCLSLIQEAGHKIILHTMRSGEELADAIKWFETKGIKLYAVNVNPAQAQWTTSPKIYADIYIEDAAVGTPLIRMSGEPRPMVDWYQVIKMLYKKGVIDIETSAEIEV